MNYYLIFSMCTVLGILGLSIIFLNLRKKLKKTRFKLMMLQQELELIRIRSINNTNFIEDLIETYKSLSGMIKDNNRYFELNEEQLKLHKKFMDLTDDKVEKLEKVIGCCKDKTTFKHFHFCP